MLRYKQNIGAKKSTGRWPDASQSVLSIGPSIRESSEQGALWWPDDIEAGLRRRVHGQDTYQSADVDVAVAVAGVHLQRRMLARQFGEHRCQVGGAERQRRGDTQAAAKITGGEDRLARLLTDGSTLPAAKK